MLLLFYVVQGQIVELFFIIYIWNYKIEPFIYHIWYDTKRNTNQQQHDNMENAGSVGNTGNVRLTNNDEEKYQMVPVPPGLLQYYVKKETILSMREDIKSLKARCTDYKKNYELECHTKENLLRLIPNTPMGLKHRDVWKILLVIKSVTEDKVCLKGALINHGTGELALISSINAAIQTEYKHRTIQSHDDQYKICQCKMIAPLLFWDELVNRLTN